MLVTARRTERLAKLASEFPNQVEFIAGDITCGAHRAALVERVRREWGALDLLINNAGVGAMGRFDDADESRLRRIFEVNVFAPLELTRATHSLLSSGRTPAVMAISSVLAHRAVPLKSEYCATKFALHGFYDSLRAEWAKEGISIVLVSPSTTDSDFFDAAIEDSTGREWKGRRPMTPDYVARRAIVAWQRDQHELILPLSGKLLVTIDRWFPALADRLIARFG